MRLLDAASNDVTQRNTHSHDFQSIERETGAFNVANKRDDDQTIHLGPFCL